MCLVLELVGRGSRRAQRLTEAVGNADPHQLLRPKSRRAVVYRGPRLGASFRPCSFITAFVRCTLVIRRAIREPRPTKDEDENEVLTNPIVAMDGRLIRATPRNSRLQNDTRPRRFQIRDESRRT